MSETGQPANVVGSAIKLANAHLQAGRLAEAESICRQVLTVEPTHFDALHLLGIAARQAGSYEQAAALIRQAIEHNPAHPTCHAAYGNLGEVLVKQKKLDEAVTCFQKAISLKPDYFHAHYNLGTALMFRRGRIREAVHHLERAVSLRPESTEARANLARAQGGLGDIGKTLAVMLQENGLVRFASDAGIRLLRPRG